MLEKIDHIGIAVHSITKARSFFENVLGLPCAGEEIVASQKVKTAFFAVGEVHIELLEPSGENSPIAKFLAGKGEGIHHIAYKTDDIAGQLARARDGGCRLINETPVSGAGGKQVAFLHPQSTLGVLMEFCAANG